MDQVVFSLGEARNKAGSESKSEESIKESHTSVELDCTEGNQTRVVRVRVGTLEHCLTEQTPH